MSKHDPEITLHQMLIHAQEAVDILHGKTRENLADDRLLVLTLISYA